MCGCNLAAAFQPGGSGRISLLNSLFAFESRMAEIVAGPLALSSRSGGARDTAPCLII